MTTKELTTEEKIKRVLIAPLGSRVMRPLFGSRLYELIDRTQDSKFILDAISWSYEAIETNLKEIKVKKVDVLSEGIVITVIDKDGELEVRVGFSEFK